MILQYNTQNNGGGAVAMAMLLPPPTKPITLPWQRGFSWGGKKVEYANLRTKLIEVSYRKIGLTNVAITQDLLSGMPLVLKLELILLWNGILPEPGQHSAQLSKLIRLTACKKAMHTISRWYRFIVWRAQGQSRLNYDPTNHRGHFNWLLSVLFSAPHPRYLSIILCTTSFSIDNTL